MIQRYNQYTAEDFDVWKLLFERQVINLQDKVHSRYFECLDAVQFSANRIPEFTALNPLLQQQSGWTIEVVKGIIPVQEFFQLLHSKRFCSSTWLRSKAQLDYLDEPDMFHDTFGHIPFLADPTYIRFVDGLAQIGVDNLDNREVLLMLQRIYWFTIEFGLIRENGNLRIYGAGLISSYGEAGHVFTDAVETIDLDWRTVIATSFRNDQIQNLYFVAESFEQLATSLPEIEALIAEFKQGGLTADDLNVTSKELEMVM